VYTSGMAQDPGPFHWYRPGSPLSEFVDFFWAYDGYLPAHAQERLLPTGTMELVFTIDSGGAAAAGIRGPHSEFTVLDTRRPFSVIAAHFRPGGGFPFFGVPSRALHNRSTPLDLLWGGHAGIIRDAMWEATTVVQRFRTLEEALLTAARGSFDRHPAVRYALAAFDRSNGALTVGDVVQRIGLSSRRFVELFQCEVGLSPKAFCRIRRFNEVLRRVERLNVVDWADVALSCGYFDQAHFNHDFRAYAGLSPSSYLRHRLARTHVAVSDATSPSPAAT
jgi:AraC-like DNA-binding protein